MQIRIFRACSRSVDEVMFMYGVRLDRFSSIDDLSKKQLQDDDLVMSILRKCKRVSTFEMSDNAAVRSAVTRLKKAGKIELNDKLGYPWHGITILDSSSGS
jgi:hypothetical protein